jgi:hypothetical protein
MLSGNVKIFDFHLVEIFKWMTVDYLKIKPERCAKNESVLTRRYFLCTAMNGIFGSQERMVMNTGTGVC